MSKPSTLTGDLLFYVCFTLYFVVVTYMTILGFFGERLTLFVVFIYLGLFAMGILPVGAYLIYKSNTRKRFGYWLSRTKYSDVVFIDENGNKTFDVCPLERKGNRTHIIDGNDRYGYEPIANRLAIIETGNAIPIVKGGYIEKKVQEEAIKAMNMPNVKPEELENKGNEPKLTKVFEWVAQKGKLKNCIIRPLHKWSSQEFQEAIKSKVIIELLRIPLDIGQVLLFILVAASVGITAYFGYQNHTALQAILKELAKSPYTPLP